MKRPPLQYWQPLWMWPGGAAMALTLLLAARRRG
jgi:Ca-activated chloride channel family protein